MNKEKLFRTLAISTVVVCITVWIPNLVFQISSPLWMLTFIIAPAGIVFASLIKNAWPIVSNVAMLFSFFILMFAGYFINYITDGTP
ncbi:hypothetical protein VKA52_16975 [Halobacillus sp. HZG1]|uniref:hypothetical protein n=1 Tax=Halobacillus sp. HZG1 TaxID=3111769 RepID=UPI002DB861C3|nr:hypothetical protein [Halobacillus sp. HZG1]MEC3885433.1 hypothetical protein [Halobacillus sp. HZG1]